MKEVYDEK
ncbi:Hypothetical protein LLA12_01139 [Lactococcus lactis subsp. lactis]|nr:Hypothetical protein LLA12_01139 [Lactococcus lactis subsp. lactis]